MERLTLQNSPHAPQAPGDNAVFFDGQDEVLAARRIKAALPAENRAQEFLVAANERDYATGRQQLQPARKRRRRLIRARRAG
jgi:hypothetical protein